MRKERYLPRSKVWGPATPAMDQKPCPPEAAWSVLPGYEHCFIGDEIPSRLRAPDHGILRSRTHARPDVWTPRGSSAATPNAWFVDFVPQQRDVAHLGFLALRGGVDVLARARVVTGAVQILVQFVVYPYGFEPSAKLPEFYGRLMGLVPGYGPSSFNQWDPFGDGTLYWMPRYWPTSVTHVDGLVPYVAEWHPDYSWRPKGEKTHVLFTPKPSYVGPYWDSLTDLPDAYIEKAMLDGHGALANIELRQPMLTSGWDGDGYTFGSSSLKLSTWGQKFADMEPLLATLIVAGDKKPTGLTAIPAIACAPYEFTVDMDGPFWFRIAYVGLRHNLPAKGKAAARQDRGCLEDLAELAAAEHIGSG